MERIIGALRSVLQSSLQLACTCPGRAPGPAQLRSPVPGVLVRNLRVRNITVHLGQRARLDRARTGRGAHRFHLGAARSTSGAPGCAHNARVAPWACVLGALSGARSVSPPRRAVVRAAHPGPARPRRERKRAKVYSNSIATPGGKTKKGLQHRDFPGGHPSQYYSGPSALNCGVLMGSGALTLGVGCAPGPAYVRAPGGGVVCVQCPVCNAVPTHHLGRNDLRSHVGRVHLGACSGRLGCTLDLAPVHQGARFAPGAHLVQGEETCSDAQNENRPRKGHRPKVGCETKKNGTRGPKLGSQVEDRATGQETTSKARNESRRLKLDKKHPSGTQLDTHGMPTHPGFHLAHLGTHPPSHPTSHPT
ncbi:hypothetical protein SUGI_1494440 [Cryptomeria japonica]|uniref:Uncharacterized protein n=1 Tax=Cryptomeria japonica TaxID=3369 RepID=A0AAD3NNS0_CRYJA|nr:hypothetical protein SUGI_1494440 [Cryptomeria japonica]